LDREAFYEEIIGSARDDGKRDLQIPDGFIPGLVRNSFVYSICRRELKDREITIA
jgi:hypothetical protein